MRKTIILILTCLPLCLPAVELESVRPVTPKTAYCMAPRWSPDGKLYCSTPKYTEILQINLENGALKPMASGMGCGFKFAFAPDGSIFFKKVTDEGRELWRMSPSGEKHILAFSPAMGLPSWYNGAIRVRFPEGVRSWNKNGEEVADSAVGWVYQDGDAIYRIREGLSPQQISMPDLESCLPLLSPDGHWVVYETLGRGLMLVNLETGASSALGPGNNACWSGDGSLLFFDRTLDDGHHLTRGDIFLLIMDDRELVNLTEALDVIALHPAVSPDGKQLAFEANGRIWIGELLP